MLVPIKEKTSLVELNGFIGKPETAKKTRGEQYIFVNKDTLDIEILIK